MDFQNLLLHVLEIDSRVILLAVVSGSVLGDIINMHKDKKIIEVNKVKRVDRPNYVLDSINLKYLSNNMFFLDISTFSELVSNNFSTKDLANFYRNISNLKVINCDCSNQVGNCVYCASYSPINNSIEITKNEEKHALFHELFHMTSAKFDRDSIYSGFSQRNNNYNIGLGLNEGYTELLTNRYFGHNELFEYTYYFEKYVAEKIELIVGKEKMESLYLNCDLLGLIGKLSKYAKTHDIMKFIVNLDFITKHIDSFNYKNAKLFEYSMISKSLKEVSIFLLNIYNNYLLHYLKNNSITRNEFEEYLKEYYNSMMMDMKFFGTTYNFLSKNDIVNYYNKALFSADLEIYNGNIRKK